MAGSQAARRFAHREAAVHLRSALELIKSLPDSAERSREELDLLVMLGPALMAIGGMATAEVRAVYLRARELCGVLDDNSQLFPILWGLWSAFNFNLELKEAQKFADELTSLAEQSGDNALKLEAHHAQWNSRWLRGELRAARVDAERGIVLYNRREHAALVSRFGGHDAGVCARASTGLLSWLLGYPDRALMMSNEAVSLGRQLEHPMGLAVALSNGAMVCQLRREREGTAKHAEAMFGLFPGVQDAVVLHGWADAAVGEQEMEAMRKAVPARMERSFQPYFIALTVEVCIRLGKNDDALDLLSTALDVVDRTDERWYESELHRLKGQLSVLTALSGAEEHFRLAVVIAREIEAKSLELRATTSLARLLSRQSKRAEARTQLADIYSWFTEGFDTADLKEAKALLDELSA
jgi:tetratricopeptide (TPR) repeat protein